MDGVQRNFSMMAEKIDRMRCLRERCDNYVRQIKLTLDETIHEQNALLNGTAIRKRLKYLGITDMPPSSPWSNNADRIYAKNTRDFDRKREFLVTDLSHGVIRPRYYCNTAHSADSNDTHILSNNYYGPGRNYERRRDYNTNNASSYDDDYLRCSNTSPLCHNTTVPMDKKNHGKIVNFRPPFCTSPPEYHHQHQQVYYFPTSKPVAQYARQTTERFYERKPTEQYAEEEAAYWRTPPPYRRPVRVVERQATYPPHHRPYVPVRRFPTTAAAAAAANDFIYRVARRHDDRDGGGGVIGAGHRYEIAADVMGRDRPFFSNSVTRPCSPVRLYNNSRDDDDAYYGYDYCKPRLENSSSLLERKIRDYVRNPRGEQRAIPTYYDEPKSTAFCSRYADFDKPSVNARRRDSETFRTRPLSDRNDDDDVPTDERIIPSERKRSNDCKSSFPPEKYDLSGVRITAADAETPANSLKRISFDFRGENAAATADTLENSSVGENSDSPQGKLILGKTTPDAESMTRLVDKHVRTSLSSDADDRTVSTGGNSKLDDVSPNAYTDFRRKSYTNGNPLESTDDDRSDFKNNYPENRSNPSALNSYEYRLSPNDERQEEEEEEKKNEAPRAEDASTGYRELVGRRDVNDSRRTSTDEAKSSFAKGHHRAENSGKSPRDSKRRQSSYKDERKPRKESIVAGSRKNSNSGGLNDARSTATVGRLHTDDLYGTAATEREAAESFAAGAVQDEKNYVASTQPVQYDDYSKTVSDGLRTGVDDDEVQRPEEISNDDYYHRPRSAAEDVERITAAAAADENYAIYPDEPAALQPVDGNGVTDVTATIDDGDEERNRTTDEYYGEYGNPGAVADNITDSSAVLRAGEYRPDNGQLREEVVCSGGDIAPVAAAAPQDDYDDGNYYGNTTVVDGAAGPDDNYYTTAERSATMDCRPTDNVENGYYYENENAGELQRDDDDGRYAAAAVENADYYYHQDYNEMQDNHQTAIRGAEYAENERYYVEGGGGGGGGNTNDDNIIRRDDDYYYGGGPVADSTERQAAITDENHGGYYEQPVGGSYGNHRQSTDRPLRYYPDDSNNPDDGSDYREKSYDDNPTAIVQDGGDYNNYSEYVVNENQS